MGLIASATSVHAAFGLCFETRDCSDNGVEVDKAGKVPPLCNSFMGAFKTNLHEDFACLVAGYAVEPGKCGKIPDRNGKKYPIHCVSQL